MDPMDTLKQLLEQNEESRRLYESLSPEQQVNLQEARQNISTHQALQAAVEAFHRRVEKR